MMPERKRYVCPECEAQPLRLHAPGCPMDRDDLTCPHCGGEVPMPHSYEPTTGRCEPIMRSGGIGTPARITERRAER